MTHKNVVYIISILITEIQSQTVIPSPGVYDNSLDVSLTPTPPGWLVECFPSSSPELDTCGGALNAGLTYEPNTNTYFIGPFSGPTTSTSNQFSNPSRLVYDNSWKISQTFYCDKDSIVDVQFNLYLCGITEGDHFIQPVYDYNRVFIQYGATTNGLEIAGDYPYWYLLPNQARGQLQ